MSVRDTKGSPSGQAVWSLVDALLTDGQSHSGPKTDKDSDFLAAPPAPAASKRSLQWVIPTSLALIALAAFAAFFSNDIRSDGGGSAAGIENVAPVADPPAETVKHTAKPKKTKPVVKQAATVPVDYVPATSGGSKPKPAAAPKASPAPKNGGKPKTPAQPSEPTQPEVPETTAGGLPIQLPELPIDLGLPGLGS